MYRQDYRNNDRVVANSREVSELIWNRIKSYIKEIEVTSKQSHRVGMGYGLEGVWKPNELNECWRLCRYQPGGHFAPHYDGNFIRSPIERSMKTFMLYLNGGFVGGATNFIDENQQLHKNPKTGIFQAEENYILLRISPEPGMAIIFNHQILHEGQQLASGLKYIMRTDIMFTKVTDPNYVKNPREVEALNLFQEAERLENDQRAMEAAECYRKAFKLWPPLADAYKS